MRGPVTVLLLLAAAVAAVLVFSSPTAPETPAPPSRLDCPVCRAAQRAGEVMIPARWPVVIRGHPPYQTAQIAFPRGRMRVEDLDYTWIRLGFDVRDPSTMELVFRREDGREARLNLGSVQYVDAHPVLPSDDRLAFSKPGTRVAVSVVSDEGTHAESTFEVVGSDPRLAGRLARVDQQLSSEPAWIRGLVRARILTDGGLHAAACREIDAVLLEYPEERHASAIRLALLTAAGLSKDSHDAEIWLDAARLVTELLLDPPAALACRVLDYRAPDPAWPPHEQGGRWRDVDPRASPK